MQSRKGLIAKSNFSQGLSSLSLDVDGQLLMSWLIKFLQQK
jgi:hypothetical protein